MIINKSNGENIANIIIIKNMPMTRNSTANRLAVAGSAPLNEIR